MLLMVEKCIREEICHAKVNIKYMKDCDENKESSYLQYWDASDFYGWEVSQKVPSNNFELIKDASQFNEDFVKTYNEEIDVGDMNFIMIYYFYLRE